MGEGANGGRKFSYYDSGKQVMDVSCMTIGLRDLTLTNNNAHRNGLVGLAGSKDPKFHSSFCKEVKLTRVLSIELNID